MKEGWKYGTLKDFCNVNYGTRVVRSNVTGNKYPVYGGGGETFRMDDYNREDCLVVSRFAMSKQCTRIVKGKFFLNDSGLTVSPKDSSALTPKLLDRFLLASNDLIYSYGRGSAQINLNVDAFKNMPMAFPISLAEQQSIVAYLDSAFAKIDAMKANAEKALNEAKALFQASLKEFFEPKDSWAEKKFGKLCEFVRGPFGGSLKKECFVDSGYAVYEQQNAIYNKFTFRYFIDEAKYNSLKRFKVNSGDLIMSCSGTIGKVAIIPEEFKEGIINQALLKLTPNKEIDAHFLKYLMESNYFEEIINANIEGVAIKNIASVAILKEIKLYIPEIGEQYLIVKKIDLLKSKVDRLQSNFDKISQECDALKQAIIRQVFE